ncbi:MAG: NAD(P)-dependent oxidoreductase [Lachnospiraceae bacterium]|nr:NAD(P)-dependent oxidoreductase [Lachnospiraceae bacterium]
MNILLIGGSGNFANSLINKLNKEKARIYLLTGHRYDSSKYQRVFERYNIGYESNAMHELFESVSFDVVVYMGAYDTNFNWRNEESDSVRYMSAFSNILMAYAAKQKGRFIYISSHEVYGTSRTGEIKEDEPQNAVSFKGLVLTQAEEMCERYRQTQGLDIVTVRLDHMYSVPTDRKDVDNPVCKFCIEGLTDGQITIRREHGISLLYEADAVEYIYKLINADMHRYAVYHISSGKVLTEGELARKIARNLDGEVRLVSISDVPGDTVLSGERFRKEFSGNYYCDNERLIEKTVLRIKSEQGIYVYGEEAKLKWYERLGKNLRLFVGIAFPFIENLLAFIPFFILNNHVEGSDYFANLDPYLIYVLLFAIVFGQQQATFSAVLSVFGFCFRQMYDRSGFEVLIDTNTYVWIAQIFILGLAVGYMHDQLNKLKRESESENEFLSHQLRDISDINSSNVRIKDALEVQVVNQNDSVGRIYKITSALNQYSAAEVLFYATEIIADLMNSESVAVYTVSNGPYARLFSYTSEKAKGFGNSFKYSDTGEFFETIVEKKVYINKTLKEGFPMMAYAIFDDAGMMQNIFMVWDISWESMSLGEANQLVIICSLIRESIMRANRYLLALEKERYESETKILSTDAFEQLIRAYLAAEKKHITEVVVLHIYSEGESIAKTAEKAGPMFRTSDYLGTMKGELYALLSNTTADEARMVVDRLQVNGLESEIVWDYE